MNGVFQFSFQKIGRSSKGNNKVEGEGGGWRRKRQLCIARNQRLMPPLANDLKLTWTC